MRDGVALEVKNLTKIFKLYRHPADRLKEIFFRKRLHKLFYANKNITFSLGQGETLGIIGVNGAGKSTLLKQIAGVLEPTSGEIFRYGRVTSLLELGTGFNPELTGRENIYFNGLLIGMGKGEIEEKMESIIQFSELGEFIDEPLKSYSSGMVMRLAFSIAIHSTPDILIVDEALSVGDAHFSAKCTRELKRLKRERLSTIYVSHDLNSLKLLCDRLILLHKGEILEEGNPEQVINRYNFLIAQLNQQEGLELRTTADYGTFEGEILKVRVFGVESEGEVIASGEEGVVEVEFRANRGLEGVTVGILIRDRFGQDIFGTNTYYLQRPISAREGEVVRVRFRMRFNLGPGRYWVTSALHTGERHNDRCIHWMDKGAEFEIAGVKGPLFTGICRLEPVVEVERGRFGEKGEQ
ncbi:MAG: ABC transporter ATP-binding protein [Campylobacterales bacterium]